MHYCAYLQSLARLSHVFFFLHAPATPVIHTLSLHDALPISVTALLTGLLEPAGVLGVVEGEPTGFLDRKSTRLNSSHVAISYAVFCLKKKNRAVKTERN